jgi:hypothetical protein
LSGSLCCREKFVQNSWIACNRRNRYHPICQCKAIMLNSLLWNEVRILLEIFRTSNFVAIETVVNDHTLQCRAFSFHNRLHDRK